MPESTVDPMQPPRQGPLDAAVIQALMRRSDRYSWLAVARIWGGLLVTLALAPALWLAVSPWLAVLMILPAGVFAYKLTFILHDCAHGSLFTGRGANLWVGRITGWAVGAQFADFRRLHWKHHTHFGTAADPQGRDYMLLQQRSRAYLAWHLIRPLFGLNLFKVGAFLPETTAPAASASWRQRVAGYGGVILVQAILAAVATAGGQVPWLIVLYPASAATIGLFLSQTRGFCEHVANSRARDEQHVRTHLPHWFDRLFFYDLNFNFHVEHHLYPSAPSCNLPALRRALTANPSDFPHSVSPSILSTIRHRLSQCPNA